MLVYTPPLPYPPPSPPPLILAWAEMEALVNHKLLFTHA